MRTRPITLDAPVPRATTRPILVGVDGSPASRATALWAVAEAEDRGLPLHLLTACAAPSGAAGAGHSGYAAEQIDAEIQHNLDILAHELDRLTRGDVEASVAVGHASQVLLTIAVDRQAALIVVGARGLRAMRRVTTGSTSLAVAGRSPVPVVVIPDGWVPTGRTSTPVVVAVEPDHVDPPVLDFAFDRAARLKVPLLMAVVQSLSDTTHPPATSAGDPRLFTELALASTIDAWQKRFPQVEVAIRAVVGHVVPSLGAVAAPAQLLVVGRHSRRLPELGLRLGSTARGVLHNAPCPVAVIPTTPHHTMDASVADRL